MPPLGLRHSPTVVAEHQSEIFGVIADLLTESDLTDLAKLVNYDALVFPSFIPTPAD